MEVLDDEDYWNTSETKANALNFDEDVSTRELLAFGGSCSVQQNRSDIDVLFTSHPFKATAIPLSKVISNKALDVLIKAQSGKELSDKTPKSIHGDKDVTITLKRLVLNRPCCLYEHKSLKNKKDLLDGAILFADGNVIINIVLFMIQTLKRKLVYEILSTRPVAVSHYISFLMNEGRISDLTDLLTMLGRSADAAMYQYHSIVKSSNNNLDSLLKKLINARANYFNQPGIDGHTSKMVGDYIKILEWQKCTNNLNLFNESAINCLAYCCENNWNEGSGKMMSPLTVCQQQQLSTMQYDWTALTVHATLRNWDMIESLFTKKNWLGKSTSSTSIPIALIVAKLNELSAPKTVLSNFISRISNAEQKLEIAKQYKVHSIVIECLAKNRDRSALMAYKLSLSPQTEEYFLAENTLRNEAIKWKS